MTRKFVVHCLNEPEQFPVPQSARVNCPTRSVLLELSANLLCSSSSGGFLLPSAIIIISMDKGGRGKNNRKSPWKWFKARFKYFLSVTALHGCGHIVREDTPLWERIVWIFIVVLALIASIVLLRISWMWNSEYPVVTVIESTHYATWNIPFPAVTVCNINKISKTQALEFAGTL